MQKLHRPLHMENSDIMKERIKYLQNIERQRQLLKLRNSSLEELVRGLGSEEDAKQMYDALRKSREGYMRIQKISPSLGRTEEGWTYVFTEGLGLILDTEDRWYNTSIVLSIDFEKCEFTTQNSVYRFEFILN